MKTGHVVLGWGFARPVLHFEGPAWGGVASAKADRCTHSHITLSPVSRHAYHRQTKAYQQWRMGTPGDSEHPSTASAKHDVFFPLITCCTVGLLCHYLVSFQPPSQGKWMALFRLQRSNQRAAAVAVCLFLLGISNRITCLLALGANADLSFSGTWDALLQQAGLGGFLQRTRSVHAACTVTGLEDY